MTDYQKEVRSKKVRELLTRDVPVFQQERFLTRIGIAMETYAELASLKDIQKEINQAGKRRAKHMSQKQKVVKRLSDEAKTYLLETIYYLPPADAESGTDDMDLLTSALYLGGHYKQLKNQRRWRGKYPFKQGKGRPTNAPEDVLVILLAHIYHEVTGNRPSGSFQDKGAIWIDDQPFSRFEYLVDTVLKLLGTSGVRVKYLVRKHLEASNY
jgi:hypothetical protein